MRQPSNQTPALVILWGGTGQAKVVRPIIEHMGGGIAAVFDDTPGLRSPFPDVPIHRGDSFENWIETKNPSDIGFCIAIGNPHGRARIELHDRLERKGLIPLTLIHPAASVAVDANIGAGSQILAGAIVGVEARLGRQCIINTNASVDHECILEDGVEIGPGATLCGLVHAEMNSWIAAGATVLPRLRIGPDAIVGAGAVVTRSVPADTCVTGVPARETPYRGNTQ